MPIKVSFRGPMLFVSDKREKDESAEVVNRVIVPLASEAGKHPDGTKAVPHTAGILVIEKGQPQRHISLAGCTVQISAAGESSLPGVDDKFLGVPPIHVMVDPDGENPQQVRRRRAPEVPPATITFQGGRLSGDMIIPDRMELTVHNSTKARDWQLTALPTWVSDASRGTITISGGDAGSGTIELGPDVEVYVYNWDVPMPTAKMLTAKMDITNGTTDDDFKWVYTLLKPSTSWKQWLKKDRKFPAPRVKKRPKGYGFTPATCNAARASGMGVA